MDNLKVAWQSPSNIALVKYWGKVPVQIPANPSVSFTLKKSLTTLAVEAQRSQSNELSVDFYFEGKNNEKFKEKIVKFLSGQIKRFPWLREFHLVMKSENTFPHSSGIASSASSMSALALCLLSLDEKIKGQSYHRDDFYKEASDLSRQASGSAGRSVYPFMATWGEMDSVVGSSNLFARAVEKDQVHSFFHHYCDSILIVDGAEKSVSSRAGHALMESHPFKEQRYVRARDNLRRLLVAMKEGEIKTFIDIVEEEALMLHALMMTSNPSYILLKPMSLELIEKIREYRQTTQVPVCFTIDAGPNIHLLYPTQFKEQVREWLSREFGSLSIIHDEVGEGPGKLQG